MSATETRLPRAEATALAWVLLGLLSPYCERVEILGSIRRGRETCGDIELLAIPKTSDDPITNMFGEVVQHRILSLLEHQLDTLLFERVLTQRQPVRWGPRYKAAAFASEFIGFPVDLFICLPPAQFGVLSVIRTGSAEFAKRLVTPMEQGGWMPPFMYCLNGSLWRIPEDRSQSAEAVQTPTEESVFAAIGRPYIPPERREV